MRKAIAILPVVSAIYPMITVADCYGTKQAIQDNYNRIKEDVKQIVKDELERIAADENLKHLIQK